jgi:hypothetical protein
MAKRSRLSWIIIIGIIFLVILIAPQFLSCPSPQPVTIPTTTGIIASDFVAPTVPETTILHGRNQQPEDPALIDPAPGQGNTCLPGDETELRVSVNGAQKGVPGTRPGAGGTFTWTSGNNTVTVVARFSQTVRRMYDGGI